MRFRGTQFGSGYQGRSIGFGPGMPARFIKWVIIANVAVFILQIISKDVTYALGLAPMRFFHDFPNTLYQVVTYMFVHGGVGHIFFNMFMLWMFGTEIEYTWGSKTFAKFYFISGICGAILTIIFPLGANLVIGASGAIWGVMIAYWMMFPNRYLYIWFLFPIKVKWAIPGFLILGFLFYPKGVAHMAHLGGVLYALVYLKLDWRLARLSRSVKNLRRKRTEAKLNRRREEAEEVMKRVDDILDKINEVGIENLSKSERKFLEEASSELSNGKD